MNDEWILTMMLVAAKLAATSDETGGEFVADLLQQVARDMGRSYARITARRVGYRLAHIARQDARVAAGLFALAVGSE